MEEKRCLLCNKPYDYKYKMFGRGCLDNIYGEGKKEFIIDEKSPREDTLIRFDDADLLYALHDATLLVKGRIDENNKWNLEIEIKDTYDFTDFKELREYTDEENSKTKDILSTTLNNLGVASRGYS